MLCATFSIICVVKKSVTRVFEAFPKTAKARFFRKERNLVRLTSTLFYKHTLLGFNFTSKWQKKPHPSHGPLVQLLQCDHCSGSSTFFFQNPAKNSASVVWISNNEYKMKIIFLHAEPLGKLQQLALYSSCHLFVIMEDSDWINCGFSHVLHS